MVCYRSISSIFLSVISLTMGTSHDALTIVNPIWKIYRANYSHKCLSNYKITHQIYMQNGIYSVSQWRVDGIGMTHLFQSHWIVSALHLLVNQSWYSTMENYLYCNTFKMQRLDYWSIVASVFLILLLMNVLFMPVWKCAITHTCSNEI